MVYTCHCDWDLRSHRKGTKHDMTRARGTHKRMFGLGIQALALLAGSSLAFASGGLDLGADFELRQPLEVDGRSFDAINFPIEAVAGQISMSARGGWVWREGNTHRIVLDHDVDVTLGEHQFLASSANIWLRKILSDDQGQASRYQVYAIFGDLKSADGTVTMKAKQLPVRGVIEIDEPISMKLGARFDGSPKFKSDTEISRFIARTEALFAQRVLGAPMPETAQADIRPWSSSSPRAATTQGQATQSSDSQQIGQTSGSASSVVPQERGPIFHPDGVFSVSIGGRIVIDGASSDAGSVITADGGVMIQYQSPSNQQWVDFKAERVVIYTIGNEPIAGVSRLGTNQIEGIYLEGGVFAGDDQWSVRSPRMYLDVLNNKALMLDAVFWTTDQKSAMPLYVRAQSIRQTAQQEFTAEKAKISNTAFFEPDLTIGVSDIKVSLNKGTRSSDGSIEQGVTVEGKNVTLNAGSVPVLWLPGFKGDPSSFPLRQVTISDSNRSGTSIRTRWNAVSLFKLNAPPGVEVDLDLDFYGDRGFAIGIRSEWMTADHRGGLFSYLLFDDNGTDIMSNGQQISRDGEVRGIFAFNDVWKVTNAWTLVTELSYISDEGFMPGLFHRRGGETEDFRNRFQLERLGDQTYFAIEMSATINDFIVPEHKLQSPGYQVNKLPEVRFLSLSKDLLPDYEPGLLTYSFEARAGLLSLSFSEVSASAYGFTNNTIANQAFGTTAVTSLGDKFRAIGLDESAVARLDTRHELRARFDMGPVRVVPFAVARATAYDSSFTAFSPGQQDEIRYWGGAGVTLSTSVSKINNQAQSRFFDVHKLRHIVEPSLTVWGGDSNFADSDLPIFDDDVEGLLVGTAVRVGIDQTWQTKRGGVGRWRDVDLLKINTEYVWSSDRAGKSPIPDFFSSRPELSNPGEFVGTSAVWQPTEVLAFAGELIYDLDAEQTARSSIGAILQHSPNFMSTIEYREVRPLDATFASLSARYRLSDKYAVNTGLNYNFDLDDFQNFNAQILRRFQIGSLGATISYNNIRGETSFGFVFRPSGSRGDLPIDSSWGG